MKRLVFIILIILNITYAVDFNSYVYNISGKIDNTLLVDKKLQKLFVLGENGNGKISAIDTFRITTGKVIGDKIKEGDNKTPEGIYTLIKKLNGERLPEKYGPLAFVLDYPNYVDRLDHRTGSNIWIHGRNEAIVDRQTEGCISLENSHILDLSKYVTLFKTKIIIIDSLESMNGDGEMLKKELKSFLDKWAKNWSEGNLEAYFSCYSENFRENGHPLKTFINRKKQLEKAYNWKEVDVDSIYFVVSGNEILANFQQTYISPRFVSIGHKTLTLVKENDDFKIVKEDFTRTGNRLELDKKIEDFIMDWKKAWETADVDTYIAFYSDSFHVKSGDKEWLYNDKKEKLAKVKKINVDISSISAISKIKNQWTVSFKQRYQADNYKDIGRKTMVIEKLENGEFKILSEIWSATK